MGQFYFSADSDKDHLDPEFRDEVIFCGRPLLGGYQVAVTLLEYGITPPALVLHFWLTMFAICGCHAGLGQENYKKYFKYIFVKNYSDNRKFNAKTYGKSAPITAAIMKDLVRQKTFCRYLEKFRSTKSIFFLWISATGLCASPNGTLYIGSPPYFIL